MPLSYKSYTYTRCQNPAWLTSPLENSTLHSAKISEGEHGRSKYHKIQFWSDNFIRDITDLLCYKKKTNVIVSFEQNSVERVTRLDNCNKVLLSRISYKSASQSLYVVEVFFLSVLVFIQIFSYNITMLNLKV